MLSTKVTWETLKHYLIKMNIRKKRHRVDLCLTYQRATPQFTVI